MLSESIHDALRARLTADFNALTHGVTEATQISQVLHELIQVTNGILCDMASIWSESRNIARRLPPEMLSSCFMMLEDLTDRMAVSHVSRAWRSASLAHPAIWADINLLVHDFRDKPALLHMALSRTGQYPVKLWADASHTAASCLAQHMNHICKLDLGSLDHLAALSLPAPVLETFSGMSGRWEVPEDFLGGQVGKLTVLNLPAVSFSPKCPALSTVTNLALSYPRYRNDAATYSRLFQLFPVLQSLSLNLIRLDFGDFLPRGPAPRSLDKLELQALDEHVDLVELYVDWQSEDNLRDVALEVDGSTVLECNLQDYITGAVDLTVLVTGGPHDATITIMASCPGQRTRAFEFYDADYDGSQAAELLMRAQAALCSVRALEIPANMLGEFARLGVFSILLKLTHIRISIEGNPSHKFHWDSLAALPRVLDARPRIKSVLITVACDEDDDDSPLAAEDARALIAVLARIGSALPGTRIKGFKEDAVRDVEILQDLNIEFDTSP